MGSIGTTNIATLLLVEQIKRAPTDRVLVLSADDPALVLAVGRDSAATSVYEASYAALQRARQQAAARAQTARIAFQDEVFPPAVADFDVAVMVTPKGRDFARAQLWSGLSALRPGGRLYMAGPSQGGTQSILDDARTLFGHSVTLCTKRRYRVGVALRPDTIPPYPWGADPTAMQPIQVETPAGPLAVATMPGIFSWQHVDDGTAFLLEHLAPLLEPGQTVLDVGCGTGILGAVAARSAAKRVVMTDDNLLAVRCARETARLNDLQNVEVKPSDVYADLKGQSFDLIVSNPPFHKDFDVNTNVAHRIMRDARSMLRPGGRLVIVANAFLKYEEVMAQHLTKSRVIARSNRFVVIEGNR